MAKGAKKELDDKEEIPTDEKEPELAIDLDEVEGDEEQDVDTSKEVPTESNSRRRARNYREVEERLSAAERRAEEADRRAAQMEGYVKELSNRRQEPAQTTADPYDQQLDNLYEEQRLIVTRLEIDKNISRDELSTLEKRARALDVKKQELIAERVARRVSPPQQHVDPVRAQLSAEYEDVYSNNNALAWAQGYANQKVATGERAAGLSLVRESLEQARRQFRMRSASQPVSDGVKARMAGVPSRSGGGGSAPRVVTMSKEYQRMAQAKYPNLSEKAANEKWAKTVGKRLLEGGQ